MAPRRISGSVWRWEKPSGSSATMDMRMTVRMAPRSEAVLEGAVGVVDAFGAEGLGEDGVEAEEDSAEPEGEGVVEDLAERGGSEGDGGVGEMADHDGVDDAHGHPADLSEDQREGKVQHGRDFAADGLDHCLFDVYQGLSTLFYLRNSASCDVAIGTMVKERCEFDFEQTIASGTDDCG